ncbi:unnamed protein product [Polarella glacialis]|uniref:Uncharacterized protein n=1 Tax=Polarella glacialis TaxID=89957 RepID=A0A813LGS2_POLGL|nr:unnamed protein product [Polarella glacialis]
MQATIKIQFQGNSVEIPFYETSFDRQEYFIQRVSSIVSNMGRGDIKLMGIGIPALVQLRTEMMLASEKDLEATERQQDADIRLQKEMLKAKVKKDRDVPGQSGRVFSRGSSNSSHGSIGGFSDRISKMIPWRVNSGAAEGTKFLARKGSCVTSASPYAVPAPEEKGAGLTRVSPFCQESDFPEQMSGDSINPDTSLGEASIENTSESKQDGIFSSLLPGSVSRPAFES